MPSDVEFVGRIAIAVLLGGLIGLDREMTDQDAGLRTHISVALGAALFGIVSAYGFDEFIGRRQDTNVQVDVTRVASNVVTGVGFLGGGAILKYGASVRGLTTAASVWVTAAVGLSVGLGGYFIAATTTGALLLALIGLRRPRRWVRLHRTITKRRVTVRLRPNADVTDVITALHGLGDAEMRSLSVQKHEDATVVHADLRGGLTADWLVDLSGRPEVAGVELT